MQLVKLIMLVDVYVDIELFMSYFTYSFASSFNETVISFFSNASYQNANQGFVRSIILLYVSSNFSSLFAVIFSILLNTCLAIDLILMLKHPFAIKEKRTIIYVIISFVIAFFTTLSWILSLQPVYVE